MVEEQPQGVSAPETEQTGRRRRTTPGLRWTSLERPEAPAFLGCSRSVATVPRRPSPQMIPGPDSLGLRERPSAPVSLVEGRTDEGQAPRPATSNCFSAVVPPSRREEAASAAEHAVLVPTTAWMAQSLGERPAVGGLILSKSFFGELFTLCGLEAPASTKWSPAVEGLLLPCRPARRWLPMIACEPCGFPA